MTDIKKAKPHDKISGIRLLNSTAFGGEVESLTIGRNCESIIPARAEFDGRFVAIDKGQRADGLLVRQTRFNPQREAFVDQVFVTWSNVREVQFGE